MQITGSDLVDKPSIQIKMRVMGPFQATATNGRDVTPRSRKARALLGILALSRPEGLTRGRLAALLWDRVAPEQARNLLRGAVHEIRSSFGAGFEDVLSATREHLTLRREHILIDVDELFAAEDGGVAAIERGETNILLLDGLDHLGRAFDEWLSATRLSFAEQVRSAATKQAQTPVSDLVVALPRSTQAQFDGPSALRQGQTGIRIGVAPLRSFSTVESDPTALVLADEISAALSRFRWLSVPSPDVVASALGAHRDAQAAFTTLGLDFLLDGQIQMLAGQVRLRASLLSAHESAIVWTFKTDRDASDLLTFQDEVAAEVAARIDSLILTTESQRVGQPALTSQNAYSLVMHAVQIACRLDPDTFATSAELLAEALRLEPNRPMAHISTALYHLISASQGWLGEPHAALKAAEAEANIALSLDPSEAQAWAIAGHVRSLLYRQPEEAVGLLKRAIEMNPNLPLAWHFSAGNYLLLGDLPQARSCIERYVKLGPTGVHFFGNSALILLCTLEGNDADAVRIGRTTIGMHRNFVAAYKPFIASLGHLGLREEAAAAYTQLRRLEPGFEAGSFVQSSGFRRPQDRERYLTGLRLAEPCNSAAAATG